MKIYLIIKKSVLMSRGFEVRAGYQKVSYAQNLPNFLQPAADDGGAAVDENVLRFLIE